MRTRDFSFNLPEELIAQHPPERRGTSRLLVYNRDSGASAHKTVADFPSLIPEDSLVIFNDTRVRKARLIAATPEGGRVEFLLLNERSPGEWVAVVQRRKRQRVGREYLFPGDRRAVLTEKPEGLAVLRFDSPIDEAYLEKHGSIPLPPYIRRQAESEDADRYQTIYSRSSGSVAAPTAGLHFTPEILARVGERARIAYVTLHVGIGTFTPIRSESLDDHSMHSEEYEISEETAALIHETRSRGGKIVAVGTTTVRTLESAAAAGRIAAGRASTELFIRPGYHFRVVDHLFTNFHTPESSLLVMVSAFAGREEILEVYRKAVEERYRFFSYGDAMLIL